MRRYQIWTEPNGHSWQTFQYRSRAELMRQIASLRHDSPSAIFLGDFPLHSWKAAKLHAVDLVADWRNDHARDSI